jgi:hypothetical protein
MRRRFFLSGFLMIAFLGNSLGVIKTRLKKVALVVGAGNYQFLDSLGCAIDDARGIAAELEKAGFLVMLVLDPDADTLQKKLSEFSQNAEGAEVACFYFSGHGAGVQESSYLLSTDADNSGKNLSCVFSLKKIKLALDAYHIANCITILDICRTNPPGRLKKKLDREQLRDTSRLINHFYSIYSCQATANSWGYKVGSNSVYTRFFLSHLRNERDKMLSIDNICTLTNKEVRDSTDNRQIPEISGSLSTEFHFYDYPIAEDGAREDSIIHTRSSIRPELPPLFRPAADSLIYDSIYFRLPTRIAPLHIKKPKIIKS